MTAADEFQPDLARSVRLFRAFGVEQTDPDRFYRTLATDTIAQIGRYAPVGGATVLDVGCGSGYFADALHERGARVVGIDCDAGEMTGRGEAPTGAVLGSALALPVRDGTADICLSSNVLEHVPDPIRMADEMLRVTRPGGLIYLSYTNWLSPHGGHETAPWHYLGGERAARRYRRRTGRAPKNRYGDTMFAVSVGTMIRWAARQTGADVLDIVPRYHPRWAHWVVRVPGVREFATWNLLLVLRRR